MSQIVKKYPPNYKEIVQRIPGVAKNKNIIFTYGSTIYNPAGNHLDEALIAHEDTHTIRQVDPELWWAKYLNDVQFRLDEELAAYRIQYQYAVEHYSRADRRRLLQHIASDLSGPMYGNLITKFEATMLITNKDKNDA